MSIGMWREERSVAQIRADRERQRENQRAATKRCKEAHGVPATTYYNQVKSRRELEQEQLGVKIQEMIKLLS